METFLEKIKRSMHDIEERPGQDLAVTMNENVRMLTHMRELLENTSDRIRKLPR